MVEDLEILCLDTDILIDFLRGEIKTTKEVKKLEDLFELTTTDSTMVHIKLEEIEMLMLLENWKID